MSKTTVHLGLGTNLGDRWDNLHQALELLSAGPGLRFQRCSQVYETEPWGVAEQPRYLNCVAEFATVLEPDPLLALCKRVERQLGRVPGERWGPRLIDVDILLWGTRVVELLHLEIPHPRLHLRAFALIPLAELVPYAVHPVLGTPIGQMAVSAGDGEGVIPQGPLQLAVDASDC